MTLDAIVKEDGTLIAKIPKALWGRKVTVTIQDNPPKSRRPRKQDAIAAIPRHEPENELTDFQTLLLHGPVMSDEQFKNFQALRETFQQWIKN